MAEPAERQATYADLEAVPPHLVAEIINGALVTHPRPAPPHSAAANVLSAKLTPSHQFGEGGPGGWVFYSEPELHLGQHVAVPDLAGWRRERLPAFPEKPYFEIAPDWLYEILSDSTEAYDRGPKRQIYAEAEVSHIWLLDPRSKLLEVFQLVAGRWLLAATFSGNDNVRAMPFEATSFPLGQFWPYEPSAT